MSSKFNKKKSGCNASVAKDPPHPSLLMRVSLPLNLLENTLRNSVAVTLRRTTTYL
jgi:hypothetical protein